MDTTRTIEAGELSADEIINAYGVVSGSR